MVRKIEAPRWLGAAASGKTSLDGEYPEDTPSESELQELVVIWWRLQGQGVRLPPEPGVIVHRGRRP